MVLIEFQPTENPTITHVVWYSEVHRNITEFSIGPNDVLQRTFVWNQIDIYHNQTCQSGIYHITAFIPEAQEDADLFGYYLFIAHVQMNITST
jgi:hypothetical protein